jgi:hypothetical protein
MITVSELTQTSPGVFPRMRDLAHEAEVLAPLDAAGARVALGALRALLADLPPAVAGPRAEGLVGIVDQLDADLRSGAVRSITGLTRQVRRLEAAGTGRSPRTRSSSP